MISTTSAKKTQLEQELKAFTDKPFDFYAESVAAVAKWQATVDSLQDQINLLAINEPIYAYNNLDPAVFISADRSSNYDLSITMPLEILAPCVVALAICECFDQWVPTHD